MVEGETGVFFEEPSAESLAGALEVFDKISWDRRRIRKNAERFSEARFLEETARILEPFLEPREQRELSACDDRSAANLPAEPGLVRS